MEVNLCTLIEKFGTDEKCRGYLEAIRWPDGVECPRCESKECYLLEQRDQFHCKGCKYHFSVTAGSIFHDSHLPLWKWFLATYMMVEAKKGVSANQLKRTIGVSYKTAWYLCHRIRKAMTEVDAPKLCGTVECDETYIGGKRRYVGSGYVGNKTMVLGALQRGGEVRLKVETRNKRATKEVLHTFVADATADETEAIYTDDNPGYEGIADYNTRHESVNHSAEEWVRGDVHTNGIEGVWSLFKRAIVGSYHQVSEKHLDAYLEEFEWRFNNRDNSYLFRDTLLKLLASEKMEYKTLIQVGH